VRPIALEFEKGPRGAAGMSETRQPIRLIGLALGLACLIATSGSLVAVASNHWYDWFEKKVLVVEPGRLVRGAWQRPAPMRRIIEREKIRTVVTLVGTSPLSQRYRDQEKLLREMGAQWIIVPVTTSRPSLEQMAEEADLLADSRLWPVFFHCIAGHHRTSLALAAYRIRHEGWTAAQAWSEASSMPWARSDADSEQDRRLVDAFAAKTTGERARR